MKAKNVFFAAGVAASATAFAAPGTPIANNGPAIEVTPTSYSVLYNIDGQLVSGPELPYPGNTSRWTGFELSFDQYLGNAADPAGYPPIGGDLPPCALASTTRYFFGTGARNAHYVNDFNAQDAAQVGQKISALAIAWQHSPVTAEWMRIQYLWWNEFNGDCAGFAPGSDSIVAARGFITGVNLTFGTGPTPPAVGYYYASVDLSALTLANMPDADGAYEGRFLTEFPPNTQWATRSQPMLWGTQADANPAPGPFPSYPGGVGNPIHWDDDGGTTPEVVSGTFTTVAPNECYNYAFAVCYRPLGGMVAWFRQSSVAPPPFALLSPADGTTDSNLTPSLSWEVSNPPPQSYTVEISLNDDLSSPFFTQTGLITDNFTVPSGTFEPCQTYYWGVIAVAGANTTRSTPVSHQYNTTGQDLSADFNGDNQVDFFDYLDFASAFDTEDPSADFNGDNQVDFFDYLDFVAAFARNC